VRSASTRTNLIENIPVEVLEVQAQLLAQTRLIELGRVWDRRFRNLATNAMDT
jgi:hypothetical protein